MCKNPLVKWDIKEEISKLIVKNLWKEMVCSTIGDPCVRIWSIDRSSSNVKSLP